MTRHCSSVEGSGGVRVASVLSRAAAGLEPGLQFRSLAGVQQVPQRPGSTSEHPVVRDRLVEDTNSNCRRRSGVDHTSLEAFYTDGLDIHYGRSRRLTPPGRPSVRDGGHGPVSREPQLTGDEEGFGYVKDARENLIGPSSRFAGPDPSGARSIRSPPHARSRRSKAPMSRYPEPPMVARYCDNSRRCPPFADTVHRKQVVETFSRSSVMFAEGR